MRALYALGIDAGGTYFKASVVDSRGNILDGSGLKSRVDSDGNRESILNAYESIILQAFDFAKKQGIAICGIGVSTPGPFDYEHHTSLMTHKMKSILGIDLKAALGSRCTFADLPMHFIHDSHAFLLGEYQAGAAKGFRNVAGITIGTGTGFALIHEGHLLENPQKGPYISIYRMPYGDATVEDYVSRRGIIRQYAALSGRSESEGFDAYDIEKFALEKGDAAAYQTYAHTGEVIAGCLHNILDAQQTECLILGGQIAKAFPLMETSLKKGLSDLPYLKKTAMGLSIGAAAQIGAAMPVFSNLA